MLDSLERDLGFSLLFRTPQGVQLTREGNRLLPAIRELLYWSQQIRDESAGILGLEQGELFVGSYYSIAFLLASGDPPVLPAGFSRDPSPCPGGREPDPAGGAPGAPAQLQSLQPPSRIPGDWVPLYQDRWWPGCRKTILWQRKRPSCRRTWKASLSSNLCPSRKRIRICFWPNIISIPMSGSPPATCIPVGPWWRQDWGCPWIMHQQPALAGR